MTAWIVNDVIGIRFNPRLIRILKKRPIADGIKVIDFILSVVDG